MSTWEKNDELTRHYLDMAASRINKPRPKEVHASDVDGLCLLKPYYRRAIKPPLPLSDLAILFLMRGLAIEFYLVEDSPPPVRKDRVWCSIDDNTVWGPVELKSTIKSARNFDPITTYPHWTTRNKCYCMAHETTDFNLGVFFLMGDYREIRTSFQSYALHFEHSELQSNWDRILDNRDVLEEMWLSDTVIPPEKVMEYHNPDRRRSQFWQCEQCEISSVCYFAQEYLEKKANGKYILK